MYLFCIMIRYVKRLGVLEVPVVAGGFGPGGVGNFSVVAAVHLVFECVGCSVEGAVDFVNHHPSPLLCFYKWGSFSPHPHFSICFRGHGSMGDCCFMGLWLNLYCGVDVGVRGNWPVLS